MIAAASGSDSATDELQVRCCLEPNSERNFAPIREVTEMLQVGDQVKLSRDYLKHGTAGGDGDGAAGGGDAYYAGDDGGADRV
jgi:hypothetical protein